MELTRDVISGKINMAPKDKNPDGQKGKTVPEVLDEHSVEPSAVGKLVCSTPGNNGNGELFTHQGQRFFNDRAYLTHLIHGSIDCDQIDYLLRDSHYTGVAHGTIDLARLLQTLTIHNNDLVVKEKGLSAVEGMLVARSLMFSSVYFHKTVRISELMLTKAVEMGLDKESSLTIQRMDDAELMGWLHSLGGFQKEMVDRLKYRRLYKAAFGKRVADLTEEQQERLLDITSGHGWVAIEKGICQRLGLKDGAIVIDIPEPDLLLSEPRIARTDIKVLSEGRLRSLSKMTPFSKAIQQKKVSRWAFLVACDKVNVPKVAKTAEKLIFD
jgi:HD superfamily phosphohydrolase